MLLYHEKVKLINRFMRLYKHSSYKTLIDTDITIKIYKKILHPELFTELIYQ